MRSIYRTFLVAPVLVFIGCGVDSEPGSGSGLPTSGTGTGTPTATANTETASATSSAVNAVSGGQVSGGQTVGTASTVSSGATGSSGTVGTVGSIGAGGGTAATGSGGQPGSTGANTGGLGGMPTTSSGGAAATTGGDTGGNVVPYAGMELFILFGQSNMSGSAPIEAQDRETNDRIQFMVQYDCSSLGLTYGDWQIATPPLHGCQWAGATTGLGPGDYFAKALAEAWPDSKIGLVPCAVPGVSIDFYQKGGISQGESYQALPEGYQSAYQMMVDRAKAAQELGRIRGILFHQGESDSGQQAWLGKVADVVSNLRADLGLGEEVPFIAGELPPTACCGGHNTLVNQLPGQIPGSAVASAQGTAVHDQYHWDSASVRVMGQRYADEFLEFVPEP